MFWCFVLFACIFFFWARERSILPVHSRAGVWIFLSFWAIFGAYLPVCCRYVGATGFCACLLCSPHSQLDTAQTFHLPHALHAQILDNFVLLGSHGYRWFLLDAPALCPCVIRISQCSGVLKHWMERREVKGKRTQHTQPWAVACSYFRQLIPAAAALSLMCFGPADSALQKIRKKKKISPLQRELDLLIHSTDIFPSKSTDFFFFFKGKVLILCEQLWYFLVSNDEYIPLQSRTVKNFFTQLVVQAGVWWSFPISPYFNQVCSYLSFEKPFLEMFSVT